MADDSCQPEKSIGDRRVAGSNPQLAEGDVDSPICVDAPQRPQRTTIFVPGATIVPAMGACSCTVPLPVICTSRPAVAACSMTLRTGRPTSVGTRSCFSLATMTVEVDGCDAAGGCVATGWGGITLPGVAVEVAFGD